MKLIVGLGNPGEKYENTRHNIGFMVVDHFLQKREALENTKWDDDKMARSLFKITVSNEEKIVLAKPYPFMNNSGLSISSLLGKFKLQPSDLIVIYDDIDLILGKIRIRFGGSSGGHNGVNSIIGTLKSDQFLRFRLGIGRPERNLEIKHFNSEKVSSHVLSPFTSTEQGAVRHMIHETIDSLELILKHGYEKYMSQYHKKRTNIL